MKKHKLFTPGPTSIPEEILLEMAKPIIHHRTDEFLSIAKEVFEGLKYLFQTKNDVLILASSGTGAMEASITNLFSKGEKIIVINGGKFGERFVEIGKVYGLEVVDVKVEWGKTLSKEELEEIIGKNKDAKGVFANLCETSTATHFDVKSYGEIVSRYDDMILVVDAISSLGAIPCYMDDWKIDCLLTGSQKAFMLPPGLAFISLSEKAWAKSKNSNLPKYYFDLRKYKKTLEKFDFPFTIPVSLIVGLRKAIEIIKQYTIEKIWEEHKKRAEATRKAIISMGLKLLSSSPSDAVTAILLPENIDGDQLLKFIRKNYGISFAPGQDKLKGKIVRISHLGWQDEFDVLTAINAFGVGLEKFGYKVDIGKGLEKAKEILFS
ncbi:MAG: alanine--glyoxylate aminotransferase family protein [Candidatus Omnitrophica bacterium]|nr:alanine--glyoxylate aminotransferase family protein [Candidatus Omnitrophota bacterium]MCM8803374.1 alanine--glyoxylate aminotransferase family protein [Candidatus Omnitrophota bacterium]